MPTFAFQKQGILQHLGFHGTFSVYHSFSEYLLQGGFDRCSTSLNTVIGDNDFPGTFSKVLNCPGRLSGMSVSDHYALQVFLVNEFGHLVAESEDFFVIDPVCRDNFDILALELQDVRPDHIVPRHPSPDCSAGDLSGCQGSVHVSD